MKAITELATGVTILAGVGVLYATGLPRGNGGATSISMDAGWYPLLLLTLALVCAGALVVGAALGQAGAAAAPDSIRPGRVAGGFSATVFYVAAFWFLGYWVATLLFVPLFSAGLGYRRPAVLSGVALLVTLVVWLVFTQALQIPLRTWPW